MIQIFAPGGTAYCATKSAVRALTKGSGWSFPPKTSDARIVSPGAVESDLKNGTSDPSSAPILVARAVLYAMQQPAGVEIDEIVPHPTAQHF